MLNFLLDRCAVLCIGGYQKYVSPRKGWNCAHRKLHGGDGCSGYVKQAIVQHGWREAVPLSRQRFADCKAAAMELQSRAQLMGNTCTQKRSRKRKRAKNSDLFCDCLPHHGCCDMVDVCVDTGHGDSGCFDCSCSN